MFEEWSAFFICGNWEDERWVSGITIQPFVLFSPTRVFSTTSAFLADRPPGFQRTIHLPRSSMSSGSESGSLWLGSPLLLCSDSIDFSDSEAGHGFEASGWCLVSGLDACGTGISLGTGVSVADVASNGKGSPCANWSPSSRIGSWAGLAGLRATRFGVSGFLGEVIQDLRSLDVDTCAGEMTGGEAAVAAASFTGISIFFDAFSLSLSMKTVLGS